MGLLNSLMLLLLFRSAAQAAKQKERLRLAALKAWKGDQAVELQTQMDREFR